jgi:hypothetical protein
MKAVTTWSSRLEPVPPMMKGGLAALAASMNSLVVFGPSTLSHSTNWSSAITDTGVRSRQLKGILADSGSM